MNQGEGIVAIRRIAILACKLDTVLLTLLTVQKVLGHRRRKGSIKRGCCIGHFEQSLSSRLTGSRIYEHMLEDLILSSGEWRNLSKVTVLSA